MAEIVAWRVTVKPWNESEAEGGVYGACRRSIAMQRSLSGARDAGYRLNWNDMRAVRAPEFDALVARHGMVSWSSDYAAIMLGAARQHNDTHGGSHADRPA